MLNLILPEEELFDDKTQEFIYFKPEPVTLEHSLISLSKWEALQETFHFNNRENA